MMKINHLLNAIIVLFVMVGCGKKVDVAFTESNVSFGSEGGSVETALTSNGEWSVDAYPEWLSVNPTSGKGNATLTLTAVANESESERSGEVRVTTKDNAATLAVTQEPRTVSFITVSPTDIESDENGGTYELEVTANCEWALSTTAEWIHCEPASGEGNGTVLVSIAPISGDVSNRETDIVFSGVDNTLIPVHVLQHAPISVYINVAPNIIAFEYNGGTQTANVYSNGDWTVTFDADWITLSEISGSGDASILVTAMENPSAFEARIAEIQFLTETGEMALLEVKQEGAPDPHFLEVSPTEFFFSKEGGSAEIAISCDTEWETQLQSDWASLSVQGGTGNGTIILTVSANTLSSTRTIDFRINSGYLSRVLSVSQEAGDDPVVAYFEVDTVYPSYNGGFQHVDLIANISWQLESTVDWISLLNTSGEGNASLDIIIDLNSSPDPRIGYLNVKHDEQLMCRLVVVQEGKPNIFETDLTELEVSSDGGDYTIHLSANQSWTLNSDVDWIRCTPENGLSDCAIVVTVSSLPSPRPRTGHIKIVGSTGAMIVVTVSQHD